ncbi:hypothetical protein [Paenibacillus rhizophilus]|uniref:Uncharacterized protein n=1 Tax=Paenibacillus rhizophilus TaxID=1850366 RepID=A0A3N9PEF6_9BACL|nr:hypothetical protein [Paenibacillus rhizophilus]RQW13394.1 hypothetical protein EH198_02910 [Paenibacillus rhizophilus]
MSVDDYLDLYNYAKQIGDAQWQAELIQTLKELKSMTEAEIREQKIKEMWNRFDDINVILLELFEKLRNGGSDIQARAWKERVWELKLERISLAKKLQDKYIHVRH